MGLIKLRWKLFHYLVTDCLISWGVGEDDNGVALATAAIYSTLTHT